jgi:hypothetical protein
MLYIILSMIMLKKVAASLATWFCCGVPASLRKKQPSGLATHYTAVFATQYIAKPFLSFVSVVVYFPSGCF